MTAARHLLGILLAVGVTAACVALSTLRIVVAPEDESLLRLSWRSVAETSDRCRPPTEAELASLPAHMRPTEICEGERTSFRLVVRVDGETRIDRELRPAGARGDRPTYVLELLPLAPGPHRLEVVFAALAESSMPPLEIAAAIDPKPRDVVLVTRDEDGDLVVRQGARTSTDEAPSS